MNLVILRSAMEDLDRGYRFYEGKEAGLGEYFEDTIYSDIESLQIYAGVHRKECGYHRLLSARFPYAIYYETDEDEIRVRGVLDCREDPERIKRRLQ